MYDEEKQSILAYWAQQLSYAATYLNDTGLDRIHKALAKVNEAVAALEESRAAPDA